MAQASSATAGRRWNTLGYQMAQLATDFSSQPIPVNNADVVGDVNQHTHGTEFYGTSSNFVLLNQFFTYAQQNLPAGQERSAPESPLQVAKKRLEREYVRVFMSNLHHIHPMLDPIAFSARCEQAIWGVHTPLERSRDQRRFFALYNIVVAVGALIADASITQNFEQDIMLCMKQPAQRQNTNVPLSSQTLSKQYFRKSRALLGDIFEVCSLESAQTLLLMSLYCQNSLKPHACYMYCGHAVRTALAIGLARESMSSSTEDRKAARRTWWCIYSHEIDMSCSAGRRDSLGKPRNYQIELPRIQAQISGVPKSSDLEPCSFAMINEMVSFAAILRRISKELYHDSKGLSLQQKSTVATELDALLDDWKAQLPAYLDFGQVSFREAEWAAKQKLVLHLRYLNARIVLHRLFLEAPMSRTTSQLSQHVDSCLDAARVTIRIMYDAYTNRHYFRTWWYNSTYTLYAGMVVLYIVMLGNTTVPSNELLDDVIKAQDILQSMEEAVVARRSANLIREGLEVARACVEDQQQRQSSRREGSDALQEHDRSQGRLPLDSISSQVGNDFSRALFSQAVPGQDPALLASIIDPNLLQDFTAADKNMSDLEFSTFQFDGLYGEGLDVDLSSIMV
ncbi:Zn(2)-C6 fungal-type DNA-binding domain-containing protein [Purpureocillium lavendulum]|uniref:Zn(2)-C6 fungal-type DNA-binding domain-containing protein n=1 Tax=Purpureocillium lavendulum TaxID=1247861 RepID=A0AB34FY03_9HYPO|nr:Zn(2)-C6 fungal-type DNA-binding domain-containing protein [Purpureocillium lavendulum]